MYTKIKLNDYIQREAKQQKTSTRAEEAKNEDKNKNDSVRNTVHHSFPLRPSDAIKRWKRSVML
jgi:hypothetical protein